MRFLTASCILFFLYYLVAWDKDVGPIVIKKTIIHRTRTGAERIRVTPTGKSINWAFH